MSKVDVRHKKFVRAILEGKTLISAYREAGYKAKTDEAAWSSASEIFRNPKVQAKIKEEMDRQEAIDRLRLDRIRSEAIIEEHKLVRSGTNDDKVKLDAIKDVLDRTGLKVAEKLEHSGKVELTLEGIIKKTYERLEDRDDNPDA
jgi:phage terminase small subunit